MQTNDSSERQNGDSEASLIGSSPNDNNHILWLSRVQAGSLAIIAGLMIAYSL